MNTSLQIAKVKKKRYNCHMKIRNFLYRRHLDEGEEIFKVAHRHWLILKIKLWKSTWFGIIPPIVLFYFFPMFFIVSLIWVLAGITHFIIKYLEWYYDCFLITNIGVIDIERHGLFDNTSKRIEYHMIDGISYTIQGFLPTILDYGDMVIDKMGSGIQINLEDAANPRKLDRTIMKYQEQFIHEKSFTDHEILKGMLADMIATHASQNGIPNIPHIDKEVAKR